MTRDEIEIGLKAAIVEALLDLVGRPLTDDVVTEINQRSEWAKVRFAAENRLEIEVVETPLGPQFKIIFDRIED